MKMCRKFFLAVMLVALCASMVLPVSAAKPADNSVGLLGITTHGTDSQYYLAVCIAEEDGNYVYSGNHPIQAQTVMYATLTNASDVNSAYAVQEDTEYEGAQGIYRFALGERFQQGTAADVFPKVEAVSKSDTVYFVSLDMNDADIIQVEKTQVSSVRGGVITTKDKLEKEAGNGDFSVIFNDNGNVVGFCKSGTATTAAPAEGGSFSYGILIAAGVVIVGAVVLFLLKKKKNGEPAPVVVPAPGGNDQVWDNDDTTLDSGTQLDDDFAPMTTASLTLKCHGGYLNGRIYPIPPEGVTIGREPDNSIRYPGQTPGISRHHAKLFWQNGQLLLLDVGSSNGTYLNNAGRINPMRPVPLNPGDVFYLGEKLNAFEVSYR